MKEENSIFFKSSQCSITCNIRYVDNTKIIQAGAELCQAQHSFS